MAIARSTEFSAVPAYIPKKVNVPSSQYRATQRPVRRIPRLQHELLQRPAWSQSSSRAAASSAACPGSHLQPRRIAPATSDSCFSSSASLATAVFSSCFGINDTALDTGQLLGQHSGHRNSATVRACRSISSAWRSRSTSASTLGNAQALTRPWPAPAVLARQYCAHVRSPPGGEQISIKLSDASACC